MSSSSLMSGPTATDSSVSKWERHIREVFALFDASGSKRISSADLSNALRSCGLRLTNAHCDLLVSEAESEADSIDLDLFLRLVDKARSMQVKTAEIEYAFAQFSDESTGMIDVNRWKQALVSLGDRLSESQIQSLLSDLGYRDGGKLHSSRVIELLQSTVPPPISAESDPSSSSSQS